MRAWKPCVLSLAIVAALAVGLSGCRREAAPTSSVSPDGYTSVGTVDNTNGMYVRVLPDTPFATVMHQAGSANECKIKDPATFAEKDIECIVEVNEHDLYFNGVTLQYNFPKDMCSYAYVEPYWFYRFEPGIGARVVSYDVSDVGAISNITIDGQAKAIGAVENGVSVDDAGGLHCQWDYTDIEGPNCCLGTYSLSVARASGGSSTTTISKGEWGGKPGDCLAGPALDTQTLNSAGFPKASDLNVTGEGKNDKLVIQAPIQKGYASNLYAANYFDRATYPADGSAVGAGDVDAPLAIRIPSNTVITINGVPMALPHGAPYFTFACKDTAWETLYRIRVQIREWDVRTEYDKGWETGTSDSGVSNEDDWTNPTQPKNDFADWLNFTSGVNDYYPGFSL